MRRTLVALVVAVAALVAPATVASAEKPSAPSPTIVDVALAVNADSGEFDTLIAAVVAADLVDALSARGQRTVFAPTDAAFAAVGLDPSNVGTAFSKDVLTDILLYHVTPGRKYAADVVSSTSLKMLNGDRAAITLSPAAIDGAPIVATDIEASNGVIHVIGGVMLP